MNNDKLLLERGVAYGIDWYFSSCITNFVNAIFYTIYTGKFEIVSLGTKMPLPLQLGSLIVSIGCVTCYFYLYTWLSPKYYGQTLGKKLTHIRVVNQDGSVASFATIAKRIAVGFVVVEGVLLSPSFIIRAILTNFLSSTMISVVLIVSSVISVISIILMVKNYDSLMLHDHIAKTKVIHE